MFQQPSQGDRVDFKDLLGCLVLIWAREVRENITTPFGEKDAIAADIHVLDGAKGGEKFENTLIFGGALIGSLRAAVGGEPVLGRVSQGMSKPGQNAPWILSPFTDADAAVATGYIQRMAKPFQAAATANPPAAAGTSPAAATPSQAAAGPATGNTVDISTLPPEVQELLRQQGQLTG
jgi:hypothetical protein